jgi:pyridoxine kinase
MESIIKHWKSLNLDFDAIYTGFLGSSKQINIIEDFISFFAHNGITIVVDPVMGDDGKFYDTIDADIAAGMKRLTAAATLITPNITEAAILLEQNSFGILSCREVKHVLDSLASLGPQYVIITSAAVEGEKYPVIAAYDKKQGKYWKIKNEYISIYYPGTGDIFTSVVTGSIMKGDSLDVAAATAAGFVTAAIRETYKYNLPERNGIIFEKVLGLLYGRTLSSYSTITEI